MAGSRRKKIISVNTTKYWLKSNPSVTAEVITGFEPDDEGGVPAFIMNYENAEPRKLYALLRLDDWSETEIISAPAEAPRSGFLALFQVQDTIFPVFVETEDGAKAFMASTNAVGYVPVTVHVDSMTPAPDDLLVLG
jgi:hypothetical protein